MSEEKYKRPWLRKCPLCKSPAKHWPYDPSYPYEEYITCSNYDCDIQIGAPFHRPKSSVVKQWNSRHK